MDHDEPITGPSQATWQGFFTLAGAWNLAVGGSFLAFEMPIRRLVGMQPERDPFLSQLFFLFVILLGWGYWRVGQDQTRNHDVLRIGIAAKVLVLVVAIAHAALGGLPWIMVTPGLVDGWFAWQFHRFLSQVAPGAGSAPRDDRPAAPAC